MSVRVVARGALATCWSERRGHDESTLSGTQHTGASIQNTGSRHTLAGIREMGCMNWLCSWVDGPPQPTIQGCGPLRVVLLGLLSPSNPSLADGALQSCDEHSQQVLCMACQHRHGGHAGGAVLPVALTGPRLTFPEPPGSSRGNVAKVSAAAERRGAPEALNSTRVWLVSLLSPAPPPGVAPPWIPISRVGDVL
jgi:hypothetical protein